jgi:hypothetical protein
MESLDSFVYDALDSSTDSIRLLFLLPYPKKANKRKTADAVCCEVVSVTFASIPKYEALSYTWGEEDATKTIELNRRSFRVRKNLYDALYHLRSEKEKRVIWVDAICINQNDNDERSCQVSIMPSIYSRAQKVLVWLGLGTSYPHPTKEFGWFEKKSMCEHRYWSRLWILQEIGLAHRLDLCQGYQAITWDEFIKGSDFQCARNDTVRRVVKFRENRYKDLRLELLLEKFQDAECSEPRDKIFGFLGLAADYWINGLTINYTISMFDLYASVIGFHQNSPPLDDVDNIEKSVDRSTRLIKFSQLVQRLLGPSVDEEAQKQVSSEHSGMLEARGFAVGEIRHLGPTYSDFVRSPNAEREWKQSFGIHYTDPRILERLRESHEACYWSSFGGEEWVPKKIRNIDAANCFGFKWDAEDSAKSAKKEPVTENTLGADPRFFICTAVSVGFAPPQAKVGDLICQFWDCDVTVVLRQQCDQDYYRIVGRAHVWMKGGPVAPIEAINLDLKSWNHYNEAAGDADFRQMMRLRLDIATLQKLTC